MKAADKPTPRDDVMFRELEDGGVIYDPKTEKVHSLNVTASVVWCMLDGQTSLDTIADEIAERTNAKRELVCDDVLRIAHEFGKQGLLE